VRRERNDPTILDHMGDVYLALGRLKEALFCWRRSLRFDPENAVVAEKLRQHAAAKEEAAE
jgi:cytochrome c-type biogenesis protein CcmH/NrfG